jgi:hypothetical protein
MTVGRKRAPRSTVRERSALAAHASRAVVTLAHLHRYCSWMAGLGLRSSGLKLRADTGEGIAQHNRCAARQQRYIGAPVSGYTHMVALVYAVHVSGVSAFDRSLD